MISSPYARRGALWDAYRKHYGKDGDPLLLIAQGGSRAFNPTLPQQIIDRAMDRDPIAASAEYGAEFRRDIENFVSLEVIEGAVVVGRRELPRIDSARYYGFCDPSGGSSDSMTLAIAHMAGDCVIVDAIRERKPPFSPDDVVKEFAGTLKAYRVGRVHGDRFGGEWPREVFRKHGIEYSVADKAKSDLYRELLPLLNSARCELLDHPRLVAQLCSLERRTARGGRNSIDHPPGAHDDVANCVAGAAVTAVQAAAVPEVPIVGPILFSLKTGETIIGPGASREPWRPYLVARASSGFPFPTRDRWSPDW